MDDVSEQATNPSLDLLLSSDDQRLFMDGYVFSR